MKKLIIFDMDGVLFNTIEPAVQYQLLKRPTSTREDYLDSLRSEAHRSQWNENHKEIERTPEQKKEDRDYYILQKTKTDLFNGIKEVIEMLHSKNISMALNTNAYKETTLPLLDNAGITQFFDVIATRDTHESKIEKFNVIERKIGVSRDETLFVTDTVSDVVDAEKAGIETIAVTWGAHPKSFFEDRTYKNLLGIVESVSDLESNLQQLI
jgi:phosphoglycolate phosphatase